MCIKPPEFLAIAGAQGDDNGGCFAAAQLFDDHHALNEVGTDRCREILLPKNGDDSLVQRYIQQQLDNDGGTQEETAC